MEKEPFLDALASRVLVFDGAMGTELQKRDPAPGDFPGGREGFSDGLTLSRPEWVRAIHESYLDAGADCIETNTFGSSRIKLEEHGHGAAAAEINRRAAALAAEAAAGRKRPAYVVGSMGPTGYLPSSSDPDLGRMPPEEIRAAFEEQAAALAAGGADALLIETGQDMLEVKLAIEAARAAAGGLPLVANVTLDQYGKMLLGTDVRAAYTTAAGMGADAFGLNCSTGPAEMEQSVRWLGDNADRPVLVAPNAGMPVNEGGRAAYRLGAAEMAGAVSGMLAACPRVRMVGGCCGTTPEHIAALRRAADAAAAGQGI